ncbi:hypothetical protein ACFQBQ_11020 [Granulicella cerasi]|uniref:Uncharacterized protein n=1 Tax=Granulicella cerasi TaxID=741063 RepID=A0ABW1ZBW3_9BACT
MKKRAISMLMCGLLWLAPLGAQQRRTRLILRDGTFQTVLDYRIEGDMVVIHSADRAGEEEEIPLKLVDLAATKRWQQEHQNAADTRPVLSGELAQAEAERAAKTAEVAPSLHLPEDISLVALDSFNGSPELVPLGQRGGDLNPETSHDELKTEVNPASSPHRLTEVRGEKSDVRLHGSQPVFYVRLEKGTNDVGTGSGMVVDTQGQNGRAVPSGARQRVAT